MEAENNSINLNHLTYAEDWETRYAFLLLLLNLSWSWLARAELRRWCNPWCISWESRRRRIRFQSFRRSSLPALHQVHFSSFKLSNTAYTNDSKETKSIYSDDIPMTISITDSSFDVWRSFFDDQASLFDVGFVAVRIWILHGREDKRLLFLLFTATDNFTVYREWMI